MLLGNNTLTINEATMMLALNEYIEKHAAELTKDADLLSVKATTEGGCQVFILELGKRTAVPIKAA